MDASLERCAAYSRQDAGLTGSLCLAQDAQEAAKAAAALDQPMVLRSKDGSRAKRTRPESSLEPLPAISSGTGLPPHMHCILAVQ